VTVRGVMFNITVMYTRGNFYLNMISFVSTKKTEKIIARSVMLT